MKKVTVSAPGKLMLFGEHAVIYNKPCLVTAIDQRMRLTLEALNEPEFRLNASDVGVSNYKKQMKDIGQGAIPKGVKFVEMAVKNLLNFVQLHQSCHSREGGNPVGINNCLARASSPLASKHSSEEGYLHGLKITTKSEFSSQYGLGSSSASAVCTIKALSELLQLKLTPKEIFDLSYQTILDVQGSGSGFDAAAAVYGGTLFFITAGKTIEPLTVNHLPLIVAYSGIKADTATLIDMVKEKADKYPKIIEGIYSGIEKLVKEAKVRLLEKDWRSVGELMNINQVYLEALGVSNGKLANMIYAARNAGAYGAKLSGAGGGDCIIAITPERNKKEVEKAINKAGGEVIKVKTNAEGVKVEK